MKQKFLVRIRLHKYIATHMTIARQRFGKHIPEFTLLTIERRPLLDNGFGYHGTKHVSEIKDTLTTVMEP
jgi:hypothetical protein